MKRITVLALFSAAATLAAGNLLAQAHAVQATMPFDFMVGNKILPSGTYTVVPVTDDVIAIQNSDKKVVALSQASSDTRQLPNGAALIFDKYQNQYFLREVLGGPSTLNADLPWAKSERKARTQETMAHDQSQISIAASEGN
jgi:hypothetical protein